MKITAAQALIKELNLWGIDHMYGIPGSSLNGMMEALEKEQANMKYIQVRQEGAGAMAATAGTKFTGKIGVAFGSGGPGASNMINGLYDAKLDRVPMLALVAQGASSIQNTHFFQETEVLPLYENVGVYNRKATNPEQIPYIVNDAIRTAYELKGPAIVILHNDYMETEIDYEPLVLDRSLPEPFKYNIPEEKTNDIVQKIKNAENPVLYVGKGAGDYRDLAVEVAERFNLPVLTSAPSVGLSFPSDHPHYMGAFGRLGTKPAYEIMQKADLVLFVGTNFPFARFWPQDIEVVYVNNTFKDLGRQIHADIAVLADAGDFFKALLATGETREATNYLTAAKTNKVNWDNWLRKIAADDSNGLAPEAVLLKIREFADKDALFGLDVGNNTMHSVRLLPLNDNQKMVLSGWFATLGYGVPAGLAGKVSEPDKQVFSISGDGGYTMNMQDILTMTRYELPVINVVLTNQSFGFIEHSQILNLEKPFGVDISDGDWAKSGEAMGAIAFQVRNLKELEDAFESIKQLQEQGNKRPILLEAKTRYFDPVDTSDMRLDPDLYSEEEIEAFKKQYNIFDMPSYTELLKELY
ncbi:thiamine pyrophosphate-dependent enzyme [Facklamia sp. 7083-14-GEN3]|uniref:thiamine pyrophosphate-dependent enzyme n=1 Tax=Facklamia sp. 7083-14-GEN3 TaxID=2973478 RepID=UPI00215C57B7|nr:thiamine pyrophosphate-binding protein [Facklamia sp. 7083-14-GEN3]MCR8969061.1 thiamine pyrophosphate-binding protein [Facklamia sp. 7083-14-GEN3]